MDWGHGQNIKNKLGQSCAKPASSLILPAHLSYHSKLSCHLTLLEPGDVTVTKLDVTVAILDATVAIL